MAADTSAGAASHTPVRVDDLLPLALSRPILARQLAGEMVANTRSPYERSVALQALTILERDSGHLAVALQHAREALRAARRCDVERIAEVLATLGLTLVHAGRSGPGLRRLEESLSVAPSHLRPRVLLRRAQAFYLTGRHQQALGDLNEAIEAFHRGGDRLWEARCLNNRFCVYRALGEATRADADAEQAQLLLDSIGQLLESVHSLQNRADAAQERGDLPMALALFDEATARYEQLGVSWSDLVIDHAQALMTAGLTGEARTMAAEALAGSNLQPVKRAELILTSAQAALAELDSDAAEGDADLAAHLFAAQSRPRWAHRARLLSLQAQYLAAHPELLHETAELVPIATDPRRRRQWHRMLREVANLVAVMEGDEAAELPLAHLLLGRVAHDLGHDADAELSLRAAAQTRSSHSPLASAAGWLAAALLALYRDDRRGLLHACRRGLDSVDEYRALLGDMELRALATRHGNELATMALRDMLRAGDARGVLWWIERWRATALVVRPARPRAEPELERDIAALRDIARRLDAADNADQSAALQRERASREAAVRRTYRHLHGSGSPGGGFDLTRVLDELGDTVLLTLMTVDGALYAVTVAGGRVRRRKVGSLGEATTEARYARFALRRAAYGRIADLAATSKRLQTALLGNAAGFVDAERVVVVPPARLLTAPWGLLPVFADVEVTVSPSATLWHAANQAIRADGHVALVTGPGLSTGESEVTLLSPLHGTSRSVGGVAATVAGALEVLDGARLAHVAAHGTFRADAPLFSSLRLHDGPLTVYDLEGLTRPPGAMVLSACDSGDSAPIGSHEALGLVSSLLAMGTSTVLASVVPVNDRATVTVMRQVHEVAGRGGSLAQGWLAARQAARGDPLLEGTAAAFTAWGA